MTALEIGLSGRQLIEASAGTGKTYTITTLFLRLLLERELTVSQILVVTYTRAATAELRERIRARLQQTLAQIGGGAAPRGDEPFLRYLAARSSQAARDRERLVSALRSFDEASIFTIHGFCQRALTDSAFESGAAFEVDFLEDQRPLVRQVVADYWAASTYAAPRDLVAHLMDARAPDKFERLAAIVASNPNLSLVPARAPLSEAPEPGAFARARQRAADLFDAERDAIARLLLSPGLNKNQFKPASIKSEWLPTLAKLRQLRAGGLPPWLAKLTPAGLVVKQGHARPAHPFFEACAELVVAAAAEARQLEAAALGLRLSLADYVRRELPSRKRDSGVQSFDDLLTALATALAGPGAAALLSRLRTSYPAALIDEFQDTDPLQYRVFSDIYQDVDTPLFLIGDPKQAIYGFRGADVYAYLEAAEAQVGPRHGLSTNYRSDPPLLRAVNHLFGDARAPFLLDGIDYHPVSPRPDAVEALSGDHDRALQFLFCPRRDGEGRERKLDAAFAQRALPAGVAGEITALLASPARLFGRPVEAKDIAVLCRTNAQARLVQAALREVGVASALEGDDSVFDTTMAAELERVLLALVQPSDGRSLRAALATSLFGLGADALYGLETPGDASGWDVWAERFFAWHEVWKERGFTQAFFRLLDEAGVQGRLLARPDGERLLTNLLHLGELLHAAAVGQHLGPQALTQWLSEMRTDEESRGGLVGESAQVRLESDAHAVRLTTVHKSKGLEYPIVFCPYLWGGQRLHPADKDFPRFHADDRRLCVDLGSQAKREHSARAEREALAENLRLLYVALTRAKHRCYVVWGAFGARQQGFFQSALGYLLHQPSLGDAAGASDLLSATEQRARALDDGGLGADLERLAAASEGAVGVRDLSPAGGPCARAPSVVALSVQRARREFATGFRVASFSSLTSAAGGDGHARPLAIAEVGLDRDEVTALDPALSPTLGDGPIAPATPMLTAPVPLHAFPAGPRAGSLMHDVYEHLDFLDASLSDVQAAAQASVERFGLSSSWAPVLGEAIWGSLYTPLAPGDANLQLARIPMRDRLNELEFTLRAGRRARRVTVKRIAELLRAHGAVGFDAAYASSLGALGEGPFFGFLRGFMDLVFRVDGRYYVVDYKSNHLGPAPADYAPARLLAPMCAHHYLLQYQLYTVALDRHLRASLPGYSYEQHFGGVFYLFVRGMGPDQPACNGVFFDRPAAGQVAALSELLCGEAADA